MKKKSITEIREKARSEYKAITPVHCPYFKEAVVFNSEGFNHIRYKAGRRERHLKAQEIRYKLLHLAPRVIGKSHTLQEHETVNQFIESKKNKRKEKALKEVHFYGFIAIINKQKVKVIVRQAGEGHKHFWSIIPNWKTRKSKEGTKKRLNHSGNMQTD